MRGTETGSGSEMTREPETKAPIGQGHALHIEERDHVDVVGEIDMVNHPPHYQSKNGGMECIEWIEAMLEPDEYTGYLKGQVLKYLWRYKDKGHPVQDLEKGDFYLNKLIEAERDDS